MDKPSLPTFIALWQRSTLRESASYQTHFGGLCALVHQNSPPDEDPSGESYAFQKGTKKGDGGDGWADVWKRDYFAWEYKSKGKSLKAAYQQLLQYREDLGNPPLLVVCDFERFEVHTNFNNSAKQIYSFTLADLGDPAPLPGARYSALDILRYLFTDPEKLRPEYTPSQVTERAAREFAALAESLRRYGADPERAARFLVRLLFCLFAQDVALLPNHLFTRLVETTRTRSVQFSRRLKELFAVMVGGGNFGTEDVPAFDGGLFADDETLELASDDMGVLARACRMDWASIEPAILGTLFERSLDPSKRSQLGAHYTSREDIALIVGPVLMEPLRREWEEVRRKAEELAARRDAAHGQARAQLGEDLHALLTGFADRLGSLRVLDPACGSGNFLYVALKQLLDLEKRAITLATSLGLETWFPRVSPDQLRGLEVNPYAHELAQASLWIGYLQWLRDNGFEFRQTPILKPLDNVLPRDAVLAHDTEGRPVEPEWPEADVIIGNPPFLGDKKMRATLGDRYVEDLRSLYEGRVPGGADFVSYWFERARALVEIGGVNRVGLLATQGIRGGVNRRVLERIKETGDIFMAWSDRPWIQDGVAVHVSMVGFDDGTEQVREVDGLPASAISADLRGDGDLTRAVRLPENAGLAFVGDMKKGAFDIPDSVAQEMIRAPLNPNGRPNVDVIRPWINGLDLVRRQRGMWIIDFGIDMPLEQACLYEQPFQYVQRHVKPQRDGVRNPLERARWWLHARPAPDLRAAVEALPRYIATPRLAKHRVFVFMATGTIPDGQIVVVARDDDYFFGVLHSRVHELWARRLGTQLREAESGFRYTPTTTFETFPFPWLPGREPAGDSRVMAVAGDARDLVEKRDQWLNPEGATEKDLAGRTLTNLYNQRPTWLDLAHRTLDEAVLDAYGWPHSLADEEILSRLLALNLERASGEKSGLQR